MDVSVGIMAHNEERNIGACIGAIIGQKTQGVNVREIIVISSSSDATNSIVRRFPQAKLVAEPRRRGKAHAINRFLEHATSPVLVLCSADVIPQDNCLEELCYPLANERIGITCSRPAPMAQESFLNRIIQLQWRMHHEISRDHPKYGELIAFKNIIRRIGRTEVDEEYIAMRIRKAGLKGAYAKDAVVLNKGPATVEDFLKQRRRIYCGHLKLKKNGYSAASLDNIFVLGRALASIRLGELHVAVAAMAMEGLGRALGIFDYLRGHDHVVWKIAGTTK